MTLPIARYQLALLIFGVACLVLLVPLSTQAATRTVCASGCEFTKLQAALNGATNGDTITLRAGETFTENITVPAKTCGTGSTYVTVRSDAPDVSLPSDGQRFAPATHGPYVPTVISGSPNLAVLTIAPNADCYRFMFIKFQIRSDGLGDIIRVGDSAATVAADQPDKIEFDRVWITGDPANGAKRGIALNGQDVKVLNSHIEEIKLAGTETQGIGGWNGPGPFTITNNYISAAGMGLLLGGADPHIPNLVPILARFDKNFVTKNPAWRTQGWTVKNVFELKNAQGPAGSDAIIEGNVFEYSWLSGQVGFAISLKSVDQDGACTWCVVQRIDFRYNIVRHAAGGINVSGHEASNGGTPVTLNNLKIRNNLFYDISTAWGDGQYLLQLGGGPINVTVDHNTTDHTSGSGAILLYGSPTLSGFVVTNNLFRRLSFGLKGDAAAEGTAALNTYAPGAVVRRNTFSGASASLYPADNFFPTETEFQAAFTDYAGQNYTLAPGHTYWDDATDGTFLGADIAQVLQLTAIAESGDNSSGSESGSTWTNEDVGAVGLAGSATLNGGVFTVQGGGSDIWGTADSFHFVHQRLIGDGQVTVRVLSVADTNEFAKAGIMMRDGLAANAAHVVLDIRPETGTVEFMTRPTPGATTTFLATGAAPVPYWLRLVRTGSVIAASTSSDGITWTDLGNTTTALGSTLDVGLIVCSHRLDRLNTSTFEGMSVLPAPWSNRDVGNTGLTGNASDVGGTFTIAGAGADVWGSSDGFHYVNRPMPGDGEIIARVASMENTSDFAKAGIMIRDGLDADGAHVALNIKPGGGLEFLKRASAGGSTAFIAGGTTTFPVWLRLTRAGTAISAAASSDGANWTTIGSTSLTTVGTAYRGLFVSSHDMTRLNTIVITNVQ